MKPSVLGAVTLLVLLGGGVAAGCGTAADDAPSGANGTGTAPASTAPASTAPASTAPATGTPSAPVESPSDSVAPTVGPDQLRSVRRTLRAYLDSWTRDGPTEAARRYLTQEFQSDSDEGMPRLVSGRIGRSVVTSRDSDDRFTLEVQLTLHFSGDPMAWNEGDNTRLVTATRSHAGAPYRLAFATSP